MDLSKRLQAVINMVGAGDIVADVGTDHGYIPISLVESGKYQKAIAMDINAGPLRRAKEHIEVYRLSDRMETRLSDGVQSLEKGECDTVVIAGMGGALTIKILEEGDSIFRQLKKFVLQPQSELHKVREYLCTHKFCIQDEDMVYDDGKFYTMMRVINGKSETYNLSELRYGKCLFQKKHPVLKQFLEKELEVKKKILLCLNDEPGEHTKRQQEVMKEMEEIQGALQRYYEVIE